MHILKTKIESEQIFVDILSGPPPKINLLASLKEGDYATSIVFTAMAVIVASTPEEKKHHFEALKAIPSNTFLNKDLNIVKSFLITILEDQPLQELQRNMPDVKDPILLLMLAVKSKTLTSQFPPKQIEELEAGMLKCIQLALARYNLLPAQIGIIMSAKTLEARKRAEQSLENDNRDRSLGAAASSLSANSSVPPPSTAKTSLLSSDFLGGSSGPSGPSGSSRSSRYGGSASDKEEDKKEKHRHAKK